MVVYVVDHKERQAFGARRSWQVTDPDAACATKRAHAKMHIAKGPPADWSRGSDGHEKWMQCPRCCCARAVCFARGHARGQ